MSTSNVLLKSRPYYMSGLGFRNFRLYRLEAVGAPGFEDLGFGV